MDTKQDTLCQSVNNSHVPCFAKRAEKSLPPGRAKTENGNLVKRKSTERKYRKQ